MAKVILTCFAGRKRYLEILFKYVKKLIDDHLIDEFHLWDFTHEKSDSEWIREFDFQIMEVKNKNSWREYYEFYANLTTDPDTVLVKIDDDIVFIDTEQFEAFIRRRRENPEYLLAFANIVNNRVVALAQRHFGLWPTFTFEELNKIHFSSDICKRVHEYFLDNWVQFVGQARERKKWPTDPTLININFFAILGKDLPLLHECWSDDEMNLSVNLPSKIGRRNYIDGSFVVSHFAFGTQRDSGLNETELLKKYLELSVALLDLPVN